MLWRISLYNRTFSCKCGEHLVKSQEEGSYKLRGKILILKGNKLYTVCKSCNTEVELPLNVTMTMSNPKLFIKR
jgi:hypothetical protein